MMPSFCHPHTSHIDNLLRTTPHLRHLSAASTDMSGGGHHGSYDESSNIFARILSIGRKGRSINAPSSVLGSMANAGGSGGGGGDVASGVVGGGGGA